MNKDNKQKKDTIEEVAEPTQNENKEGNKELTVEEKLKESEDKLLRSLAEIENQRRRYGKLKEISLRFNFSSNQYHVRAKENESRKSFSAIKASQLFMSKSARNRTNWYFGNPLYARLYTERKVGSASTILLLQL